MSSCHVFIDIRNIFGDEFELGKFIFELMIKTILDKTCMKIVHQHLCVLNIDTPPGFTSVLLLDSSHFTSHSYSKKGTLSCDLFTCGTDRSVLIDAMDFFIENIKQKYPFCEVMNYKINFRHL